MAEGVMAGKIHAAGLEDLINVDSAGTHGYHVGEAPDARAQKTLSKFGYDISRLRGRQVLREDFLRFDLVLAMDVNNLKALERLCPPEFLPKLKLFLDFSARYKGESVPDPYYGGQGGFDRVFDMVQDASDGLLEFFRQ